MAQLNLVELKSEMNSLVLKVRTLEKSIDAISDQIKGTSGTEVL